MSVIDSEPEEAWILYGDVLDIDKARILDLYDSSPYAEDFLRWSA